MPTKEQIINAIGELDETDTATVVVAAVTRLGQHGRTGREALEPMLANADDSADLTEGFGQLAELDVVKQFA